VPCLAPPLRYSMGVLAGVHELIASGPGVPARDLASVSPGGEDSASVAGREFRAASRLVGRPSGRVGDQFAASMAAIIWRIDSL
jgi:hypothetical protein